MKTETRREPLTPYEKIYYDYTDLLEKNSKDLLDNDNWMLLFDVLDKLHIHEDYVLDDYRTKGSNNNTLELYARPKSMNRPSEDDFFRWECNHRPFMVSYYFDITKVSPSVLSQYKEDGKIAEPQHFPAFIDPLQVIYLKEDPTSIWQAFMLCITDTFIGQRWHGGYSKHKLVFCIEDIHKHMLFEDYGMKKSGPLPELEESVFTPEVVIDRNDGSYLKFLWWNNWSGLSKVKVPFKYSYSHNTIHFGKFESENLYKYDCGLRY